MRHSYRCHASSDALDRDRSPSEKRERYCVDSVDLLDTARCPCCRVPLVARMGQDGPYFYCHCRGYLSFSRDAPRSAVYVSPERSLSG